jgi:hypothetical protein
MRRSIATLAATVLTLAVPAAARAEWTAPEALSGGISEPSCCGDLEFASDGRGAALWSEHSQESHTNGRYTGFQMPTRTAGGSWFAHSHRPHGAAAVEPLRFSLAADGGLVLFGLRLSRPGYVNQRTTGLAARFGHLTASGITIKHTQRLLRSRTFDSPTFAANATGDAVAAWAVRNASSGPRLRVQEGVYARLRGAGGRFGKIRRLARRPSAFSFLTAAVGARGDVAVVWRRGGKIFARIAPQGGDFGKRLLVGAGKGRPSAAVGPHGEVVVAWTRKVVDEDRLRAAVREPGHDFVRETRINWSAHRAPLVTAFDRSERALIGWQSSVQGHPVEQEVIAHVTMLGAGPPQTVTMPSDGPVVDIAASRDNRVAAVVVGPTGVRVALRSASGSWAPLELASTARADGASLAFDPLTGQPNVVYQVPQPGEPTESAFAVERGG